MINFRQLTTFATVVELGSFTRAAKTLYMTQPAISWQIKSLETDLGLTLLERRDRTVLLTEAGKLFYEDARCLTNLYEQLLADMEEYKSMERGNLKIGASTIPGEYLLPGYIGRFKELYPGIQVALAIANTGVIVEKLLQDSVHLGLIGAKIEEPKLSLTPFLEDELILVAAPESGLADKGAVTLQDVVGQDCLMREAASGTRMVIQEALAAQGLALEELQVTMELGSTRAVITAVEAGLGISWVSRWAAADALRLGNLKEIQVEGLKMERKLYLATHQHRTLSPLSKAFIGFLLPQELS